MMHASGTPDSVPSLATTSKGSTDTEDLTRVLFEELENETPLKLTRVASIREPGRDPSAASDYYEELLATNSAVSRSSSPLEHNRQDEPRLVGIQKMENDAPSDVPPNASCSGALNISPGELANIFSLFQRTQHDHPPYQNFGGDSGPKRSPTSVVLQEVEEDAATEVTSNTAPSIVQRMPQLESLHRECEALKQIIRTDSASMLQLKSDLDTLRKDMTKNVSTIHRLQKKLELVQRERDLQKERENQHLETIAALKTEADGVRVSQQELSQIRMENELFAAQIIENENELRKSKIELEAAQAENARLTEYQRESSTTAKEAASEEESAQQETESPLKAVDRSAAEQQTDLVSKVMALEMRLANMEAEREQTKRDTSLLAQRKSGSERQGEEEVEVTLIGPVAGGPGEEKSGKGQDADKSAVSVCGSVFCDCFVPSTSTVSNNEES